MAKRNIALGFYQQVSTAKKVVVELKKQRYTRFATIYHKTDHTFDIERFFSVTDLVFPLILLAAALCLLLLQYFTLIELPWLSLGIITTALIAAAGGGLAWLYSRVLNSEIISRYQKRVVVDEILVILEVDQQDIREALSILREVKSGHPVTFLIRPQEFETKNIEITSVPVTLDLLRQEAGRLAYSLQRTNSGKENSQPLMKHFKNSSRRLHLLQENIADAEYIEQVVPVSAEWLLDNMYVIEGSIDDVKLNLPKKYYKELPKIPSGPLAGYPRIYALAIELVKNSAGSLSRENITAFLESYQLNYPLTIGELWAFPLMLRLRLIEWVENLAVRIDKRMREGELASFWGNRLLYAARHDTEKLPFLIADLTKAQTAISPHFAEELLDHLFDEETILPTVRNQLEEHFKSPLEEILHQEHLEETSEQVVFSNLIRSLLALSQLSWQEVFETVSAVDVILRQDREGLYSKMDFATRNSYRGVLEQIARRVHMDEVELAKLTLSLASNGIKPYEQHVGYYLIDKGRRVLEKKVGFHPNFIESLQRAIIKYHTSVYLGGIALFVFVIEAFLYRCLAESGLSTFQTVFFLILSLLPASEITVQTFNLLLTMILPTPLRPKMSFEKGIPPEYKTLVVVPMLLQTPESIREEVNRLEIRYLANTDPILRFGLFSDFPDAPEQFLESDVGLLASAVEGIQSLELKYGSGKFFLFHRQRSWSRSENAWIGWERKRGKLEYLNRFLMGETLPENILYKGDAAELKGTRYVITLDADTQLPKDQARAMIEVLSHPLNQPYLSTNKHSLDRGYTIIQPRVGTDFIHAKASLFSQIFSEPTAVDPYTLAISNVNQDLTGEGSYHGKGIYDVQAFHSILSQHFPDEHLLSHDLIEGAFVRVGFASHICLFDTHPKDYSTWSMRQHRWIRGDWQIIDWLFPTVPIKNGKEANPLSLFNRWKVFDNLRRALLLIALVASLVADWLLSPVPGLLTALATVVIFLPTIALCINQFLAFPFPPFTPFFYELKSILLRTITLIALLPLEAYYSLDAMFRVAYRRIVSKKNLLQWLSSDNISFLEKKQQWFDLQLKLVSCFALIVFGSVMTVSPNAALMALPFCLLWLGVPLIVRFIDKPHEITLDKDLPNSDKIFLRKIARKTWRYFDELIGPSTHWMPPDNYQTALNIEIAQRTSPTNIGMWLLAMLNAYDFKYITFDNLVDKAYATINELKKLERHEGHFLNWYNIQTLDPLFPRYVSTVDSGNLLACLWTLKHGLHEIAASSIIQHDALSGVQDTFEILKETNKSSKIEEARRLFDAASAVDLSHFVIILKEALKEVQGLSVKSVESYWLKQIEEQLLGWDSVISRYFGWVELLASLSQEKIQTIDPQAHTWKALTLSWKPSLEMLASHEVLPAFEKLIAAAQQTSMTDEIKSWGKKLQEALSTAQWLAGEKMGLIEQLKRDIDIFSQEMNLKFVYNSERKLFAIGYNVDDRRLDTSHYDLLASEARLASLVAIAKNDVPLDHWWALGRVYTIVRRRKVLLSWGGTMFEYLMPLIFNKQYPDSLLGDACMAAVDCQIAYGRKRGIPWGISESAYSAIDSHKTYQYKSFGIPGLGLKRGLEDDLVVSPYSTGLALSINASAALKNLRTMAEKSSLNLVGTYGYYESMDFTRQRSPAGERGVIVYVYMAHHQGMILSTINNVLNNEVLIKRFHKDPRICGVCSLLYERIPFGVHAKIPGGGKDQNLRRLKEFSETPIMGVVETPESLTPKINLLSNEKYSVMVTNTGGGYSRWNNIDIYRWRADTTRDAWGSFCYIKDIKSGDVWSVAYQPTQTRGVGYSVNFKSDKAEFRRKDYQIETFTEVVVSPEDNAEIRLITLINHSSETRYIELTSYQELALAPHLADRAHPCFNKLFIETEAVPELSALLGFRRLRSPHDLPIWAVHVLASNIVPETDIQYETDRARFIGRGKTLMKPAALEGDLSKTTGTVLDPIFSLRQRIVLEPGRRAQLSFVTAIADNRITAVALAEKYKDIAASHRSLELAWNYAQLELRHLRIHQEEVQLFQKLASRIIYPHMQLRTSYERLRKNLLGQSALWAQGISGDFPIVAVTVGDIYDVDLVKQLLIAHTFWSLRGLKVDLVIFNEEEAGYYQPLQEHLQSQIQAYSYRNPINEPGGVFLRSTQKITTEEFNLILTVARVVMVASRGSLRQQLVSPKQKTTLPPKLIINEQLREEPSSPLPFLELPYFNGIGGFTTDGRAYVIYLGPETNTPAPWINVLANPRFGTLVSEAGIGCSWYGNSQTNRLTPWSNDPILNPISDAIYIRDEDMGTFWTPTPGPIRELDAYRISHNQGYTRFEHNSHGIEQELLVFVPVDDAGGLPLRVQSLRLTNRSSHRRKLSLTAYSEWVLGGDREDIQMHVVTEWDTESQALFAYNHYNPDFAGYVAFTFSIQPVASFSGDRTEFIGRNRSSALPEALTRKSLSGNIGAGLDPCSALQVVVEIDPGKNSETVFVMGYAPDIETARKLIKDARELGKIDEMFTGTCSWWDKTLGTIQVDVPDAATNFLMNRWLVYQALSCRFWGRSAFYQSSGAYGFRDQLQDSMAFLYSVPKLAREYILYAASRQFTEGDVQHWWHPQTGAGIRTRCSDDLLWLPFVTAQYVRVTGDTGILDEKIPFLQADELTEGQEEVFQIPLVSTEEGTLLEHCRRAVNKGVTAGPHGLPLIGSCDWNDGMNLVGIEGKGESVWLAWFLIHTLNDFAYLLSLSGGNKGAAEDLRLKAKQLAKAVEVTCWDGAWYRRAYFDNGTPIGSKDNNEACIDSIAQSWAVIAGLANSDRVTMALDSAEDYLVKAKENLVLLLTPPFDKTTLNPGYIKGYPPGVRENGGQYTHAATWLAMAYARRGNGNKAVDLLRMISPVSHTHTKEDNDLYLVEPYVIAADIYDLKGRVGRGGWTWYTGAASWVYRVWLEEVLGFKLRGEVLLINPCIPKDWEQFKLQYKYKSTLYEIKVSNPNRLNHGKTKVTVDGTLQDSQEIALRDDGGQHSVEIVMEAEKGNDGSDIVAEVSS